MSLGLVVGVGFHHFSINFSSPSGQFLAECGELGRFGLGEIGGFAEVFPEVVELDAFGIESLDQFPLTLAEDAGWNGVWVAIVVRVVPVEGIAIKGFGSLEEWMEVKPVTVLGGMWG